MDLRRSRRRETSFREVPRSPSRVCAATETHRWPRATDAIDDDCAMLKIALLWRL